MEGNGFSQLVEIIREIGRNDFDKFEYATVIAPPPSIIIRVDNMPIDLDRDDVVIAGHLLEHERAAKIDSGGGYNDVTIAFDHALPAGQRILVASMNNGQKYAVLATIGGGV